MIDGPDYGPLAGLLGQWSGREVTDVAPAPVGDEHNAYYKNWSFVAADDVTGAEQQTLAIVRYHQKVRRVSAGTVVHYRVGYWLWRAATDEVMQTLTIPRGVTIEGDKLCSFEATTVDIYGKYAYQNTDENRLTRL